MQIVNTDVIVFGYGPITQHLMKKFQQSNVAVTCVTNNEYSQLLSNDNRDIRFFSRNEIVNTKLNSKTTIFSWRNTDPLINNEQRIQNWLFSNQFNTSRSFLLSSASVYKDLSRALEETDSNIEKKTGQSAKNYLEKSLSALFKQKLINHMNIRISNTYGPGLKHGFVGSVIQSLISGSPIQIFENLNIIRDYVSVTDVIYAINELTKVDTSTRAVNLSTGIGTAISEVLDIFESYGYFVNNRILVPAPIELKFSSILNPDLLSTLIDWQPTVLKNGIAKVLRDELS
jgi:nucleoside-diphosphate-sugar epimerase